MSDLSADALTHCQQAWLDPDRPTELRLRRDLVWPRPLPESDPEPVEEDVENVNTREPNDDG